MWYAPRDVGSPSRPGATAMTRGREACLRRADVERVFDLIAFLRTDAQAIVEDETACTLADLVGSI